MIRVYAGTDKGIVRASNQDCYACGELGDRLAFAVLCDGMGGQKGGHIASERAVGFVEEMLSRDLNADMPEGRLRGVMMSAAAGANAIVHDSAKADPELYGMGTTLIIAVFIDAYVFVAYVGDSRAYHLSAGGEVKQLTKDHTVVQMLLDIGEISSEEARNHPKRHYITRAVGVYPTVDVDFLEHSFLPGDTVLLCSDGLYNYTEEDMLPELLRQSLRECGVNNLIGLANAGGGADNITAVVVFREPDEQACGHTQSGGEGLSGV